MGGMDGMGHAGDMGSAKKYAFPILIALVIIASGLAYYFRVQLVQLKANPQKIAQEEVAQVVGRISQIMVLPDEQPTLATVADPEKLKDQPFFINAKIGDKVLFYTNARKAVLYDPVANKIVEVAPINFGNNAPAAPAPAPAPKR